MMYIGGEISVQSLFEELKKQALHERISDINQYKELMENLIEEKKGYGFLDDDEDLPQMAYDLMLKWPEVEGILAENAGVPMR